MACLKSGPMHDREAAGDFFHRNHISISLLCIRDNRAMCAMASGLVMCIRHSPSPCPGGRLQGCHMSCAESPCGEANSCWRHGEGWVAAAAAAAIAGSGISSPGCCLAHCRVQSCACWAPQGHLPSPVLVMQGPAAREWSAADYLRKMQDLLPQ